MDQTVSVIINVFNGGRYIEEALVSALNQTYRKCEVLVFDNCSNDDTAEICNKYKNKIAYYKNSKTVPLYAARNKALELINGTYVAFLDSDDIWVEDKIEKQIIEAKKYPNSVVYGAFEFIDSRSRVIMNRPAIKPYSSTKITKQLLKLNKVSIGSVLIPKAFLTPNPFDEKLELLGDFVLWFELSRKYEFIGIGDVLELSRDHASNISKNNQNLWCDEAWGFIFNNLKFENFFLFPYFLFFGLKFELIRLKSLLT